MNKVAIIGYGYVGRAMHKIFPEAVIYDPFAKDIISATKEEVNQCLLSVICVPTPTSDDGVSCDTSIVEETLEWLETKLILIKSTVKPGTTQKLNEMYSKWICFSPEYVGEGGYFVQYWKYPDPHNPKMHDFMIIGGRKSAATEIADIFVRAMGAHVRFMFTDSKTAEVIKYTENMWIATKVTFVNEMYEVCKSLGVDWHDVREGWLLDSRVGEMYTAVFTDKRGFEGKCLPKDTKALIQSVKESGYEPTFLESVLENNNRIRKHNNFEPV